MATEPHLEKITDALLTLINGVTTGNGFHHTIEVARSMTVDFRDTSPSHLKGVLFIQDADRMTDQESYGTARWMVNYVLEVFVRESKAATIIETITNRIMADVDKRIQTDPVLGGLAIDTVLTGMGYLATNPNFTGLVLEISVNYQTGLVDIKCFAPINLIGADKFNITFVPAIDDIFTIRNLIITFEEEDLTVTAIGITV